MLMRIIALNVLVFLVINLVLIFGNLSGAALPFFSSTASRLVYWISAPSAFSEFIVRPWTWFTYMFVHQDFWHILSNMLILYFVGRVFCDMLGDRRFLPTYIFGGLAGLAVYVIAYNIAPKFYDTHSILYGASASVMAIFLATATYFPDYEVYLFGIFRVKLKWLAVVYVVLDFLALKGQDNLGGHLAHLGGAAYGFFYARQLAKGSDWSEFMYRLTGSVSGLFAPGKKVKVVHRSTVPLKGQTSSPSKAEKQQIIDTILDKISRSGYESLTKAEKDTLLKAGEE